MPDEAAEAVMAVVLFALIACLPGCSSVAWMVKTPPCEVTSETLPGGTVRVFDPCGRGGSR